MTPADTFSTTTATTWPCSRNTTGQIEINLGHAKLRRAEIEADLRRLTATGPFTRRQWNAAERTEQARRNLARVTREIAVLTVALATRRLQAEDV